MRIIAFETRDGPAFASREGECVAPFSGLAGRDFAALAAELAAGRYPNVGAVRPLSEICLLPPVPAPGKILCIGLNYADHAAEGGHPIPAYPAVFMRTRESFTAHGQPLVKPLASDRFDYEAELAVVIGSTARNVNRKQALDHVLGYTCLNDGSLRDFQRKSTQWTMGKIFDRSGSYGPEIVTGDEVPPGACGLRVMARLNGEVLQDGTTADMLFDVATIIETLSATTTLNPGDIIATGTPAGVGFARQPPVFMKDGDVIEIEIEGIGLLRNIIQNEVR